MQQIATDANAIRFGIWVISILLTIIIGIGGFALKMYFATQKEKQAQQCSFNKNITEAVTGLRSDLKEYTIEIKADISALEKRIDGHDIALAKHSEKLNTLQNSKKK